MLNEKLIARAFTRLDSDGDGAVEEAELLESLRLRYTCSQVVTFTEALSVKGGKTLRRLDVGETVEGLEPPTTDEQLGLSRVRVKSDKDGMEGWVTISGNAGKVFLEPFSPFSTMVKRAENILHEVFVAARGAHKQVEAKQEELRSAPAGLATSLRTDLQKMTPRIKKV